MQVTSYLCPWPEMKPISLIYERGITIRVVGSAWHIANIFGERPEQVSHPSVVTERYGVRPVVMTVPCSIGKENTHDILLCMTGTSSFAANVMEISEHMMPIFHAFHKQLNLIYLLRAVQYHSIQLARQYSEICSRFSDVRSKNPLDGDNCLFQGEPEAYFEFDALITAIRRTYDSCRYMLWQFFGPANQHVPISFYKTLPLCTSLPKQLSERLSSSWETYGKDVTDYRDCIQHYAPLDFGLCSIQMEKIDNRIWTARVFIPDNPSSKSRSKFLYSKERDALTYGWELANEILEVASALMNVINEKIRIE